ncbi:MAG: metallophosphoesterase family protein, partial [Phycisphaerales bacterium]|nr:metallophosphoesterase family protein [Phycisphaerales bacterium]
REAVRLLRDAGAELLLHLGDIETEEVLDELIGHPVRVVFGNCDDEQRLGRYCEHMEIINDHPAGRLEIDGRSVVFTHGHLSSIIAGALDAGADYLLHGHTHVASDDRESRTRIVNPGALHRAARYTVAVLDVSHDTLTTIEVPARVRS